MKIWFLILVLPLCSGCSMVKELKKPPYPYFVTHHTRVVGIEASVPNQAGDAIWKLRIGFFSDAKALIPCSTNAMFIPAISETFSLGQSFMDTTIKEDMVTGWAGVPPPSRHLKLFAPPEKKTK